MQRDEAHNYLDLDNQLLEKTNILLGGGGDVGVQIVCLRPCAAIGRTDSLVPHIRCRKGFRLEST